jgi:cytochrome c-type biogenesis protein
MDSSSLTIGLAFIAGLASFLSPCVFPLVPAYIGYLGGRSVASSASSQGDRPDRWITLSHALAFILGFSLVFLSLGMATSALGQALRDIRPILSRVGGVVVAIFGIHMTGLLRISFLEYDLRPQSVPDRRWGYLSSALMGVFFSAGWSPCIGPVLGLIMQLSLLEGSIVRGMVLLAAYSAGLAIPFLVAATQITLVTTVIRRFGKLMRYVEVAMGVLLLVMGLLMVLNKFTLFANLGASFIDIVEDEAQVGKVMLAVILGAAAAGLIPAAIARRKRRNFVDWWFFGFGLFPVALLVALLIKPVVDRSDEQGNNIEAAR